MNIHVAQHIVAMVPLLREIERVQRLPKGYSKDKKYVLWESGKPKYLLRLSNIEFRERCQKEFDIMAKHHGRGIPCPEPYVFGIAEDSKVCYSIISYLPGQCAEEVLPKLTEKEQFAIGVVAGQELHKLHQFPCPEQDFDWYTRRKTKYLHRVKAAKELKLTFVRQDEIGRYVEAKLDILRDSPVRFQHDDYHPGNLIIHNGKFAGIIDFNRFDWGDPIHDFYKVPWFTCAVSIPFARGQILGYFSGKVPREFWHRYNLYVAMSLHGSLVWEYHNFPNELKFWQKRIKEIVNTHDFRNSGPPAWFVTS
ncbi:aminoglycoside phosphotransferase family protein [bacterium]|nr:aminoglycoside phosphotransferase family protein [bacterium]